MVVRATNWRVDVLPGPFCRLLPSPRRMPAFLSSACWQCTAVRARKMAPEKVRKGEEIMAVEGRRMVAVMPQCNCRQLKLSEATAFAIVSS